MNKLLGKFRYVLKYLFFGLFFGYYDVNMCVIYYFIFRKIMKWVFRKMFFKVWDEKKI